MTINSKQNCIHDLNASLTRTANWRRALQTKFPNDPRNGRAAERLDQLATEPKTSVRKRGTNFKSSTVGLLANGLMPCREHRDKLSFATPTLFRPSQKP